MRIAIAEIGQETCSFTPVRTTIDTFRQYGLYEGEAVLTERTAGVGTISGMLTAAQEEKIDLVSLPIISAWAGANGELTPDTLACLTEKLVASLRHALPVDGFFFSLHGAAAAENEPDVEGHLLAAARAVLGPTVPIVAPLDHHANLTQRMVDNLDALVGHRTQPHDPYDTGYLAGKLLFALVRGDIKPTMAWRKIPMLTHQEQYLTSRGPMKEWFDRARHFERRPGVVSASPFPIQCWLDAPEGGWAAVVITDNDQPLAEKLASELAQMAWHSRERFWIFESIPPAAAIQRAVAAEKGLVVLSDTGDSVFGGATGDSTCLLAEMLHQGVTDIALMPMVDPETVAVAWAAGKGATITVKLGGKLDPLFGKPVEVTAQIVDLAEGMLEAPVIGRASFDMGKTVLLACGINGAIKVVVSEQVGVGGNHPIVYRRFGLEPAQAKMIVLKTASNFQYYTEMTSEVIRVDTPGPTMSHLEKFTWQHVPRPIYPLDDLPDWQA